MFYFFFLYSRKWKNAAHEDDLAEQSGKVSYGAGECTEL